MTEEKCVLCGEKLNNGKPVNREHYVPHVLIRNFKKLKVHPSYSWALRIDLRGDEGEATLSPKSAHKTWATVRTHTKCNSDASPMCQDMKKIIDNIDGKNHREDRILEYYAHLWGVSPDELELRILGDEELEEIYESGNFGITYAPGYLWVGKMVISLKESPRVLKVNDYENHTIFMGPEEILEDVIKDYSDGEIPDYANPYSNMKW